MDINLADMSALGIVVLILIMANKWAQQLFAILNLHLKQQNKLMAACQAELTAIKEFLSSNVSL